MASPRVSLAQTAIDQIKGMIARGEIRAGDRLPTEMELAARLGVSRGSLREAVRGLALVGILEVRQGDGTYVTSLEPDLLLQSISFFAELNQDGTLSQILEARRMLESPAAAQAASRATVDQLSRLGRLVEEMSQCDTVDAFVENDLAFHRLIALAAGNQVVVALLDNLSSRTARARVWRGVTEAGANRRTQDEHAAIAEALRRRRGDVAAALVTAHIVGVQAWFEQTTHRPPRGEAAAHPG